MSQWTHVAGIIRVDSLTAALVMRPEITHQMEKEKLEEWLSNTAPPMGSEGPAQWKVDITAEGNSLNRGHITVWGDLRDFGEEDVDSIREWWRWVLTETLGIHAPPHEGAIPWHFLVRQAVMIVDIERGDTLIYLWDCQNGQFEERRLNFTKPDLPAVDGEDNDEN